MYGQKINVLLSAQMHFRAILHSTKNYRKQVVHRFKRLRLQNYYHLLFIDCWYIEQCTKHTGLQGGERGLVAGRWICNPEVPGSKPPPCHWMDLSSVAPNSTPPRLVNSQLVSLPPVGILNLLCLICIIFVCYAHLNIFTWNLRDINVYHYYYYSISCNNN